METEAEKLLEKIWALFVKSDMDNLNAEQAKKLTKQLALITLEDTIKELNALSKKMCERDGAVLINRVNALQQAIKALEC